MTITFYLSAFMLGFLGSFHCAGMCGPLALMLPKSNESAFNVAAGRFIYNTGRLFTYVIIGLFFGMLGLAIAMRGFQRELSVITGIIILVSVIITSLKFNRIKLFSSSNAFTSFIRRMLKKLFADKSWLSLFFIGVLNGLLPCGFVYLAIAGAAASASLAGGMIYMALFGLGTFPIMMIITVAANFIGINLRRMFSGVSTIVAVIIAMFLIYRGTFMKMDECCNEGRASHAAVYCPAPSVLNSLK